VLKRPVPSAQLRRADYMMLVIVLVASAFLLWGCYVSAATNVPELGVFGYLTGPMFAHKLSEILVAGAWLWFAFIHNHEKANLWPSWMPPQRRQRSLHLSAAMALWSIVPGTYAWTILNLGTSARTTNIVEPPGIGDEWFVWRIYLGAVVIAGGLYVMLAVKKIAQEPAAHSR
jgi:hypothetical protein